MKAFTVIFVLATLAILLGLAHMPARPPRNRNRNNRDY